MRLEKIKLAGFKSFVDPTTLVFPERLVAIVGPNGCGKSNLVDAVRFVIGESSAKHLRGDTLSDVIFNGSSTRKPASLASVELVFANDEGRLGGEYASFAQIALRREITRDGESRYFLNGTRCRRRDILDVLLGTGLGPQAYAIIEQGMISHFIEAKPEELRLFVEEAAGLSKYKERRHETELKLAHVQANLERAEDIRRELRQQVERLAKQAKKAEKYRQLTQSIRHRQEELIALRWRQAESEYQSKQTQVIELERTLAESQCALNQAERSLALARAEAHSAGQKLHAQQAELYELDAAISRCDQNLRHAQKTLKEREATLAAWRAELARFREAGIEVQTQLDGLHRERGRLEQELKQCQLLLSAAQNRLGAAVVRWQGSQQMFEREREAHRQEQAKIELLRLEVQHLERQLEQARERGNQLAKESDRLEQALSSLDLTDLAQQYAHAQAERELKLKAIETTSQKVCELTERKQTLERSLRELEGESSRLQGEVSALETWQRRALGKDRLGLNEWLAQHGQEQVQRLAEVLDIEAGWERAVESALSEWLDAIWVSDLASLSQAVAELRENAALLELRPRAGQVPDAALAARLKTPWDLPQLSGFRCSSTLAEALTRRAELAEHECWITPNGDQVGTNWVRLKRQNSAQPGVLERERTLQQLRRRREILEQKRRKEHEQLERVDCALAKTEQTLRALHVEERASHALCERLAAELRAAQARQAEIQSRLEQLRQEAKTAAHQCRTLSTDLASRTQDLTSWLELAPARAQALEKLQEECNQALAERERLEAEVRRSKDSQARLETALERLAHTQELLSANLQRAKSQEQQLKQRLEQAEAEQSAGQLPIEQARKELETLLASRTLLEDKMAQSRAALECAEAALQEQNSAWRRLEEEHERVKSALEKARLAAEAARARWQTIQAQIQAERVDLSRALQTLPESANLQDLLQSLEQLKAQHESMGEVNLAAIEEHRIHSERLRFLDKQCEDLSAAAALLEKAIGQIDRESRSCFRTTLEAIDRHFQRYFPLLFGGGEARLELLGEELWAAGVKVVARPPGKRNSSIHLLSGGEKALAAVALVFSFFELNPAPVCLLDEVDAPLDEANVERFCQLLKSLAQRVQFIFVTHNKTTMENADQLIGVTMREPGVSRIVAVDLKQAAAMAAA